MKGNNIAIGCDEFEDTIGDYNNYTLDLLDASIVKIKNNGMKALISPHNANLLSSEHGYTPDIYGTTCGSGDSKFIDFLIWIQQDLQGNASSHKFKCILGPKQPLHITTASPRS